MESNYFQDILIEPNLITGGNMHIQPFHHKNHSTKFTSTSLSSGYFNESVNVCSGREDERVTTFVPPTHLKFTKSQNVDLRTMRMLNQTTVAGYNPFRGDFEVEYDNNAEELLGIAATLNDYANVDNSKKKDKQAKKLDKLSTELQVALVECYNSRLKERHKRKNIIKNFGLLNRKGTHRWYSKLQNSIGKSNIKKMMHFSQLLPVKNIEYLFCTLQNLYEKRAQINKLIFYRNQHGVTNKNTLNLAENVKKKDRICERVDIRNLITPSTVKRNRTPLQIFHLPRYRELTSQEAEFCSSNNLVPEFFLDTKDHLISDCSKHDGMLLKRARKLVKIDVNKTRKIFDFMMEQGLIWPPPK